ncbi:MAG: tetratricopeptide repeat protein [Acidobacteriota bacterium]
MSDLFTRLQEPKMIVALFLAGIVLMVYSPVIDFEFVDLDDDLYVRDNLRITRGVTWDNLSWALSTFREGVWNPTTWVSFMLDYQLFGMTPGAFHFTNVILHTASVILLFIVLQQMTGALWSSALVASLFALHPLNVESVAWVTERKNVLSTLFGMLTLWAYLGYLKKPGWQRYTGVLGFLTLGLMAKQMLVTLPCILLLLDYWPLRRLGENWTQIRQRFPRLVMEKLPLFIPVAGASVLTIRAAQSTQEALPSLEILPFGFRLANAVVAYANYLLMMVWPTGLAVFYPHQGTSLDLWTVTAASLFLAGISWAVWQARGSGYLEVGWLWYLGTLVPVSGLIQAGGHSMADRHTYVPLIGVFIMVVWGGNRLAQTLQLKKAWLIGAGTCLLLIMTLLTRHQLGYWQNGATLFRHAVESTENNHLAHSNLGTFLLRNGDLDQAIDHFQKTLEIAPRFAPAHTNLGTALRRKGIMDEAVNHFLMALEIQPDIPEVYNNLGIVLAQMGKPEEALQQFATAVQVQPEYIVAYYNSGLLLKDLNRIEEAIFQFRQTLILDPFHADARQHLDILEKQVRE